MQVSGDMTQTTIDHDDDDIDAMYLFQGTDTCYGDGDVDILLIAPCNLCL